VVRARDVMRISGVKAGSLGCDIGLAYDTCSVVIFLAKKRDEIIAADPGRK
jgi:hypothetical protein